MKRLINLFIIFVLLFSLATSLFIAQKPILADAGPVHLFGVNITPYQENNVRLVKEDLSITVPKESKDTSEGEIYVYAKFVFVNEGEKASVKMGFPFGISEKTVGAVPFPRDVKVKVDGKTIEPNYISTETSEYDPWVYFDVLFNKGEMKVVEINYIAVPLGGYFTYILNTGALWKGPIGTLDVEIKFPHDLNYSCLFSLKPEGYVIQGSKAVYHFTNFKPKQDIEMEFLPENFYNQIVSIKEKAEKSNSPIDWFNYALSLFPRDPFGLFLSVKDGGFVGSYKSESFKDYVFSVIDKAKSLQKKESVEYKILDAIERAHTDAEYLPQFVSGFENLEVEHEINGLLDNALMEFEQDIDKPQSKLEGRMIAYLIEYEVFADFTYNNPIKGISSFNTLLNLAEKYFDKEDFYEIPYFLLVSENFKYAPPAFMECFIPKVKIGGSVVTISYALPLSMQEMLKNSFISSEYGLVNSQFDKTPPYAYTVTLNFNSANNINSFNNDKSRILGLIKEQMPARDSDVNEANITYKLVEIYLEDMLDNLTLKDGKLVSVASSIDCTSKINGALKNLDNEVNNLKTYKNKLLDVNDFIGPILTYLDSNKGLLVSALDNPKIEFETANAKSNVSVQNKSYVVMALSAAVILLIIALIVVVLKMKKSSVS